MMIEHDPELRAVEATLFAAEQPMTTDQIRAYVGDEVDVSSALSRLAEHYEGPRHRTRKARE
jgi:segregation and condensation protein B